MKIFKHFNQESVCPICKQNTDGQAVLIPIDGTANDGICEAMQVHLNCINLRWRTDHRYMLIYQSIVKKEENK
jgi:hypothetical protein